eukprot:TRINITY_DN65245_c0_g1_i1.p1 TRINITY_DN65245_c0_g1~~TRINITY_DN65245_c0_g1_i1.p1  ORF type:complete len:230 (-),score=38.92 TRINITY_DN65245_c0_g1_i1:331-1020(-)
MTLPRLRYFMFPGRCYAARVALFNSFGKDGWIDERLGQTQFRKLKAQAAEQRKAKDAAVLITDNLPQLVLPDGKTQVTQSHAIARWAARQMEPSSNSYVLYPDKDLDAALLVDEAMSMVDAMVGFAPKDADKDVRMTKRQAYADEGGFLHIGLSILESRLRDSGGPFLLGAQLSIGDLYLKKPLTDMILDKQFEGVAPEYLDQFSLVRAHTDAVASHPLIHEYLKHYKN